jgi:hypothetical protein
MYKIRRKLRKIDKRILIMLLIILVFIIGIILLINMISSKSISKLERIKLEDTSLEVMSYFSELQTCNTSEIDGYVNFAIEYNYQKNNILSTTVDDAYNIITSIFSIDINKEDIASLGISPCMLDKSINYDDENEIFILNRDNITYSDIANTKIYDYNISKIKKVNNKKYVIYYDAYLIENPYEILNYYDDLGESEISSYVLAYLKNEASLSTIRKYITKDVLKGVGVKQDTLKVTYKIKNDNLVVDSYK